MSKFRNLILFSLICFLLFINIAFSCGHIFSSTFYFFSMNIALSTIVIIEVIYGFHLSETIKNLRKEIGKLDLTLSDYKLESILLKTIISLIETEEMKVEEVTEKIADSLKEIFKNETIVICLFGGRFLRKVIGEDIVDTDILEEISIKGKPLLINNTGSFPLYRNLAKKGITSFIISPFYSRKVITGVIGIFSRKNRKFSTKELELLRMVTAPTSLIIENAELFEKTRILSITDALTSIYNRRFFETKLEEIYLKSKTYKKKFSLSICDIDYFKFYNDANGHPLGDIVLKKVAEIIKNGVKGSDIVARYGGEEFVIVFPETDKEDAVKVCEKLREKIEKYNFPYEKKQPNGNLTVSFGIATFPDDASTPEDLLKKADFALYKAKEMGKNSVVSA